MHFTTTIITGTEHSRNKFNPLITDLIKIHSSSLVVNISLLPTIQPFLSNLQLRPCVVIVSSAQELLEALSVINPTKQPPPQSLDDAENLSPNDNDSQETANDQNASSNGRNMLVAGCVSNQLERAAIRLIVLRNFNCGICITSQPAKNGLENEQENEENDDPITETDRKIQTSKHHTNNPGGESQSKGHARRVFDTVLTHWNTTKANKARANFSTDAISKSDSININESDEKEIWGDPVWSLGEDLIIPPGWDSEAKICAVVEANGDSFEQDVEIRTSSDKAHNLTNETTLNGREKEECETSLVPHWFQSHNSWLEEMAKLPKEERKSNDKRKGVENDSRADAAVHTDYFQRLLSSTTRR